MSQMALRRMVLMLLWHLILAWQLQAAIREGRQAGKAGSRQGKKLPPDLQCGFNEEKEVCKFCL
jgi:hypothetical protein